MFYMPSTWFLVLILVDIACILGFFIVKHGGFAFFSFILSWILAGMMFSGLVGDLYAGTFVSNQFMPIALIMALLGIIMGYISGRIYLPQLLGDNRKWKI